MSDTIKGAIIGALITTIGSILIFFLGNFSTQATLEKILLKHYQSILNLWIRICLISKLYRRHMRIIKM